MLIYWLLFAYFAVGALALPGREQNQPVRRDWLLVGTLLVTLMIGLRYQVGADWQAYEMFYSYAEYASFRLDVAGGDPGYEAINWLCQSLGFRLWVMNLICGAIFTWGLYRLCKVQRLPLLGMLIAVPYLVIVVAMGYTRQSVAIGILMAGLAALIEGKSLLRFAGYVFVAALFHKTAVVAFPLAALTGGRSLVVNILLGAFCGFLLYTAFLEDSMAGFVKNYIQAAYSSQGALIRLAMNVVPALLALFAARRLGLSDAERKLWRNFAIGSFILLGLLFVVPSSTAIDRIALYLLPIQIAILSRIPGTLMTERGGRIAVVVYSFAVQFVWLNFAVHADFWVPYRVFPVFS